MYIYVYITHSHPASFLQVPSLGGHWGVWGAGLAKGASEMGVLREGTHLWMRVERDRSTSTLDGMGGLRGVRESFSLWGQPQLDSLQVRGCKEGVKG